MQRYLALEKIIETGSFSKAAEALSCTQSAISQMIASLESELSITLLKRSRSGITLTQEGRELYPSLEQMLNNYRVFNEKVGEIKGLDKGTIRMGTIASVSAHWMPKLIKEFKEIYPNIEFLMHQGDYTSIQEWIKTGKVDFGFLNPKAVTGLETETVQEGKMVAILPPNHPLSSLNVIPLELLVREKFLLLEEGHYYEPLEAFKAKGLTPQIEYTIHDDYTIMAMVEAGLGVSIVTNLILKRSNYNLVTRDTDPVIKRTVGIGYKQKEALPLASKRFISFLKSKIDELPS